MATSAETFWCILQEEMATRGIQSFRALEKAGGVSNGTISGRERDNKPPTTTTIDAIARALRVAPERVMTWQRGRKAPDDDMRADLLYMLNELSPEDQQLVLVYIRAVHELRERERSSVEQPGS